MLTFQERKLILRMNESSKTQEEIAHLLGCSQACVSKWISKSKSGRSLETLPRSGRPTKLTTKALKSLQKKVFHAIRSVNDDYGSLNTKELSLLITEEIGEEYSLRHVERILHKIGLSLIKPRSKHIKQDPQKIEEFREKFKKNFKRSIWIISS